MLQVLPLLALLTLMLWVGPSNPRTWHQDPHMPAWLRIESVVLPVVLAAEGWFLGWWTGVTLTPGAAIVHNLRRRTIPWTNVAYVAVEPSSGGRRIVLYETNGRRTALRAPSTAPLAWDRHFDTKAATIHHYWRTHTDPAAINRQQTAPTPPALPSRLPLRRSIHQTWLPALVLTLVAVEVAVAGFVSDGATHATLLSCSIGAAAAVILLLCAANLAVRPVVQLTPEHMRIRRPLSRPRTIAWTDIRDIRVTRHRGTWKVVVEDNAGQPLPLPAPYAGRLLWDRAFDAKTATLLYWWRTYITPDRQAPGNTPTEPRATYTGPRWWQQAIVSLAWLLTVYFLLLYSVVGTLFALI
jgi:hypothetical protein